MTPTPEDLKWLDERLAFEADPKNRIEVSTSPIRWHPSVAGIRRELVDAAKRWEDWQRRQATPRPRSSKPALNLDAVMWTGHGSERLLTPRHWRSPVKVTASTYERALCIANALAWAAEERGCKLVLPDQREPFWLHLERAQVRLAIREKTTVANAAGARQGLRATGKLLIQMDFGMPERRLDDQTSRPLESRLNEVFSILYHRAIDARLTLRAEEERRIRAEASAEESRQLEAKRKEAADSVDRANAERQSLLMHADAWVRAKEIRTFVEAALDCRAEHLAIAHGSLEQWALWALAVADDMDPLVAQNSRH